jgi:hypothetical protein
VKLLEDFFTTLAIGFVLDRALVLGDDLRPRIAAIAAFVILRAADRIREGLEKRG